MPRDNEHKVYKEKWACFGCRKCFKRPSYYDLRVKSPFEIAKKQKVVCPQCRMSMSCMGWDFQVPKQKDVEQWKKVELLIAYGYNFHSVCHWQEPHAGPGTRPARLRDLKAFIEKEEQKKKFANQELKEVAR